MDKKALFYSIFLPFCIGLRFHTEGWNWSWGLCCNVPYRCVKILERGSNASALSLCPRPIYSSQYILHYGAGYTRLYQLVTAFGWELISCGTVFCYLLLFDLFFLRVFMFAIHVCWFDNSDRFNGLLSPALRFLFYYFPISLTSSRLHVVLMDYIHTFSCTWPCSPGLCIPCIMHNSVHVVSRSLFLLFTVFCLLDGFPFFCCFEKKTPLVLQNASQPAWYMLQNYSRWNESKAFRLFKYA